MQITINDDVLRRAAEEMAEISFTREQRFGPVPAGRAAMLDAVARAIASMDLDGLLKDAIKRRAAVLADEIVDAALARRMRERMKYLRDSGQLFKEA